MDKETICDVWARLRCLSSELEDADAYSLSMAIQYLADRLESGMGREDHIADERKKVTDGLKKVDGNVVPFGGE